MNLTFTFLTQVDEKNLKGMDPHTHSQPPCNLTNTHKTFLSLMLGKDCISLFFEEEAVTFELQYF